MKISSLRVFTVGDKFMAAMPEITLSSGGRIPVLGMGTAAYPIPDPEVVEAAVLEAIELGYRHFDSASLYDSEVPLGRAIRRAIESGLIRSRGELFITTKLACADASPDGVVPALLESLEALGLEYVDLYLVHAPMRARGKRRFEFTADDLIPFDARGTWEGMEECYRLGLAKAIGVSNFPSHKLKHLLSHAKIVPVLNQVEMHPLWQQKELREFCMDNGIHVSAYSPLGGAGSFWGTHDVLQLEAINQIAQSRGKTVAQVCLRWAYEQGASILPKSFDKERLKENMGLFDWKLSKEDLRKISLIPQPIPHEHALELARSR